MISALGAEGRGFDSLLRSFNPSEIPLTHVIFLNLCIVFRTSCHFAMTIYRYFRTRDSNTNLGKSAQALIHLGRHQGASGRLYIMIITNWMPRPDSREILGNSPSTDHKYPINWKYGERQWIETFQEASGIKRHMTQKTLKGLHRIWFDNNFLHIKSGIIIL